MKKGHTRYGYALDDALYMAGNDHLGSHILMNEPLSTYTLTSLYVFLAQSLSFIIIVIAIFIKIFEASKSITDIHR